MAASPIASQSLTKSCVAASLDPYCNPEPGGGSFTISEGSAFYPLTVALWLTIQLLNPLQVDNS